MSDMYQKMSQTMTITGFGFAEPEAVAKVVERCKERWPHAHNFEVHARERSQTGWLEYLVTVHSSMSVPFTFAAIQRTLGAEWEFHS